jgi:hypothetical protein
VSGDSRTYSSEILVVGGVFQMEPVLVLLREAGQHAVEDVVVPLLQMSSFNGHVEKTTFEIYHPIYPLVKYRVRSPKFI